MSSHTVIDRCVEPRDGERGSALLLALLVAVVLVFLGMGLLLQTSLGLEAAGTDRWVVKSLYAADAGCMAQINMVRQGQVGAPGNFTLTDDTNLQGLLRGQFNVTISEFCETEPAGPILDDDGNPVPSQYPEFQMRHFHFRSDAGRVLGGLAGLTQAAVEVDMSAFPFSEDDFVPVIACFR
jgi:hypothetical protein